MHLKVEKIYAPYILLACLSLLCSSASHDAMFATDTIGEAHGRERKVEEAMARSYVLNKTSMAVVMGTTTTIARLTRVVLSGNTNCREPETKREHENFRARYGGQSRPGSEPKLAIAPLA